ncbi:MAG: electron transfer flavoprotein subunit beta/FixA family protein [Synergistaceae bacterium]|nr:electron transfer flavoprotein subunit beta/FixA family protein [Synergistaceae bacterium]
MRIAVLMKQVPDTDDVKMDAERGTMIRDGVGGIVNPLDLNALEAAVGLRGEGGSIVVVSMGPPAAEEVLREGLALGADRAILATDRAFAGCDSLSTSRVLAAVLKRDGVPDLVIAGGKATDGETGQVGPEVAALLGMPVADNVTRLSACPDGVEVECTLEDGILTQRLPMPCLVTVQSDINSPSLPTLSGKKRASAAEVERVSASDLGMAPPDTGLDASPTRVVRITSQRVARQPEKFFAKKSDSLEKGLDRIMEILEASGAIGRGGGAVERL